MIRILGISAFYHDSAAALLENGKIVNCIQEERLSRKKNDSCQTFWSLYIQNRDVGAMTLMESRVDARQTRQHLLLELFKWQLCHCLVIKINRTKLKGGEEGVEEGGQEKALTRRQTLRDRIRSWHRQKNRRMMRKLHDW